MIKILILSLFISSLFSANIMQPTSEFKSSGAVVDIVYTAGKLYSATDASCVDIFDFQTKKIIKKIKVDQITDFMGDIIDSKVYSVDVIKDKVLLLSQAKEGARRVHIYTNDSLNLIIPYSEKLLIAKAKFLDENTILLALLGSELISYDVKNKKINYRTQVSQSKFSNFALNETKTQVVVADESGDLKIYNTKDGVFVKKTKWSKFR